jgi:hypothetical protein
MSPSEGGNRQPKTVFAQVKRLFLAKSVFYMFQLQHRAPGSFISSDGSFAITRAVNRRSLFRLHGSAHAKRDVA